MWRVLSWFLLISQSIPCKDLPATRSAPEPPGARATGKANMPATAAKPVEIVQHEVDEVTKRVLANAPGPQTSATTREFEDAQQTAADEAALKAERVAIA